jgi:hypothetical protein
VARTEEAGYEEPAGLGEDCMAGRYVWKLGSRWEGEVCRRDGELSDEWNVSYGYARGDVSASKSNFE